MLPGIVVQTPRCSGDNQQPSKAGAQGVLQQMFLFEPFAIQHSIDLVRVYAQQNRYQQAKQHLQILMSMEKRLALNSPGYKPQINESLLQEDSILREVSRK